MMFSGPKEKAALEAALLQRGAVIVVAPSQLELTIVIDAGLSCTQDTESLQIEVLVDGRSRGCVRAGTEAEVVGSVVPLFEGLSADLTLLASLSVAAAWSVCWMGEHAEVQCKVALNEAGLTLLGAAIHYHICDPTC